MRIGFVFVALGALALSGCISISRRPHPLIGQIAQSAPRECPAEARREPVGGGETERVGVAEYELSRTPLSGGRGTLRMRRLDIAPGGVIPLHEHSTRQALSLILEGEMMEYRSDCAVALRYRVGEIVQEGAGVSHYWRNESGANAVVLVTDVLP